MIMELLTLQITIFLDNFKYKIIKVKKNLSIFDRFFLL